MHRMLGKGPGGVLDHFSGFSTQQGLSDSHSLSQMSGPDARRPEAGSLPMSSGPGFGGGTLDEDGGSKSVQQGMADGGGGGNFDFNKFFGSMNATGPSGNMPMQNAGHPGEANKVPDRMLSLAGHICLELGLPPAGVGWRRRGGERAGVVAIVPI